MATQPTHVARKGQDAEFANVDVADDLAVTGNLAVTGTSTLTGALTGNIVGGVQYTVAVISADGALAIPSTSTVYFITEDSDGAAITLVDPTADDDDGLQLTFISTTAQAHTLDLVTGINGGSADIGTFGGAAGDGVTIIAYQGEWFQVPGQNENVTFA